MFRKWWHGLLVGLFIGVVFVAVPGAQTYLWSSINGVPFAPGIMVGAGSEAAPSIAFAGDSDTGIYKVANGYIGFVSNGGRVMQTQSTGLVITSNPATISFISSATSAVLESASGSRALTLKDADGGGPIDFRLSAGSGSYMSYKAVTELVTVAAAATTDTTVTIPANAIVYAVSVRVTTVIPTAATFTVTGASSGTAFQTGASVSTAATSTDAGTKACPYLNTTEQAIRITPNTSPANNTGRVRVVVYYMQVVPPTS